jgi:hypothetical protein
MAIHACFKCFRCFRRILQVFHLDEVKVDLDVAYAAMAIHSCFKRMSQLFHLFQTYVASILSRCCKSRSGVAHVAMAAAAGGQRPSAATYCYC